MPFYEKGDVRIRYEEVGSGFPLLVTPGGGLNSRVSNWPTAVFNAMEVFKDDFRCITMDQRNANGGESTGPIPVDDPWGAFADDQLGLMDHLGIREFFFMGYCIGGCFALKLMERAPDRVVAGVLCQTGRASAGRPGRHVPLRPRCLGARISRPAARRDDGDDRGLPAQPLPRQPGLRLQRVARLRAHLPDADAGPAGRHPRAPASEIDGCRVARPQSRDHRFPWREPPELLAQTIDRVRRFFRAQRPASAS